MAYLKASISILTLSREHWQLLAFSPTDIQAGKAKLTASAIL